MKENSIDKDTRVQSQNICPPEDRNIAEGSEEGELKEVKEPDDRETRRKKATGQEFGSI